MEWYSQWLYGMNRDSKFLLFAVWIVLFLFLHANTSVWLPWDRIGSILVATVILYVVYQQWIYHNYSTMEQLNNQLIQINIDKYPYLQTDLNIVKFLLDLKPMMRYDRIKYTELVETLDEFFKYHKELNNIHYDKSQLYDACYDCAKKSLNILSNFVFNSPIYPILEANRQVTNQKTLVIPNIEGYGEILKGILSKYLDEIEQTVNKEWKRGDINYLSKPVITGQPDPMDSSFEPNYHIY